SMADPITYAGLVVAAEAAGSRLSRDFGFESGSVAAILLPNGNDFIHAWASCLFAGLVDVSINYELKKSTLLYGLSTVGAKVVITDESGFVRLLEEDVRSYLPRLRLIVIAGECNKIA